MWYNVKKEGASTLASAEWEFGTFHKDNQTVEILCSVAPKEYDPSKTTASIMVNDKEVPMTFEGGKCIANIPVSVFEEIEITQVMFYKGEMIRAEGLEWFITPLQEFLPSVDAYLGGSSMGAGKNGKFHWSSKDTLEVFIGKKNEDYAVKSITIVRCLDGKETDRVEMPLQENLTDYFWTVDLEYEIPYGSTQEIYVDVVDSLGLCYRSWIDYTSVEEDGGYIGGDPYSTEKMILDQSGKELYRGFW